jgi:hypothetical protein
MKRPLCKLLLVVFFCPTVCFGQVNVESQIKRVEQGLLPAVLVKGDPGWSITERMKFYRVPGLSITVIKNFRVEWARAYGVKDLETNEPVSTETLFQAGSPSKSVNAAVAMKKVGRERFRLMRTSTTNSFPGNSPTMNYREPHRRRGSGRANAGSRTAEGRKRKTVGSGQCAVGERGKSSVVNSEQQ